MQPSLVIVYFGGNVSMGAHSSRLGPHVPLSDYVENMRKIALHLKVISSHTRLYYEVRRIYSSSICTCSQGEIEL